jgi:hypothetical protein
MFGTNFKSSLGVLPWLLVPLAVYVFFVTVAGPWIQENGYALREDSRGFPSDSVEDFFEDVDDFIDGGLDLNEDGESDGDFNNFDEFFDEVGSSGQISSRWKYYAECFGISTIIAIIINFLFVMIIPCALGGYNKNAKRGQFYLGFFINLAALVALPTVYLLIYKLDYTTYAILLGMHLLAFMGTFIPSSRFVSPAYKKAFWFAG